MKPASVVVNPDNLYHPTEPRETTPEQHSAPAWVRTRSTILGARRVAGVGWPLEWVIGFKEITASTNGRTALRAHKASAPVLVANMNNFAFDYRRPVEGFTARH